MPGKKGTTRAPERGQQVADARRGAGLTQQQLAEEVGVGRVSIARIEAGTAPSVTIALAIGRTVGKSVEELFGGER